MLVCSYNSTLLAHTYCVSTIFSGLNSYNFKVKRHVAVSFSYGKGKLRKKLIITSERCLD
jgi:hypothetical protein